MGLERLRVEKCCCCASLRTGCLIIAILSLLSTIATIFGMGGNIVGGNHTDAAKNKVSNQANMILKGLICAISLLLCIGLIYGTIKKNRKLLKSWVILKTIECVLVLLMVVKLIYALVVVHGREKGLIGGLLVGVIIEFILCCYLVLVVWSHYLELGDEETAAANINSPEATKLNDVTLSSNC
ncbi:hypothetical protein CBL_01159 [Carabus blaptoides fortunei]